MVEPTVVKRKLAVILAADVEGYSRLMGADEEATLKSLSAYREIIDGLIARHRRHHARVREASLGRAGPSIPGPLVAPDRSPSLHRARLEDQPEPLRQPGPRHRVAGEPRRLVRLDNCGKGTVSHEGGTQR